MTATLSLIGTGVALGIVHVLTGPDHLSALATLSANVDWRASFFLGVRWGIGHSTGLLLVGTIFIIITRTSDNDTIDVPQGVSRFFESLVGVFMIMLGAYGIRNALEHRPNKPYGTIPNSEGGNVAALVDSEAGQPATISYHNHAHPHAISPEVEPGLEEATTNSTMELGYESSSDSSSEGCLQRLASSVSTRTMALFAGVIHGLAGPGGVLGVIPAVQLHNSRLAAIYLGCFCISSTLTMGTFAVVYGTCSARLGESIRSAFVIELVSAGLSILVGITWLVLLSIGKLEDVFP